MELTPYVTTEAFWTDLLPPLKQLYKNENDFYNYLVQIIQINEGGRDWVKQHIGSQHYTHLIPKFKEICEAHSSDIGKHLPKYNIIDSQFSILYCTLYAHNLINTYAKITAQEGYDFYQTIHEYVQQWPRDHNTYLRLLDKKEIKYYPATMDKVISYLNEHGRNVEDEKNMLFILNYFVKNPDIVPLQQQQELFCMFTKKFSSISKSSIKKYEKIKIYFEKYDFSDFYEAYPHIKQAFNEIKSYGVVNGNYFMFEMDVNRFAFDNNLVLTDLKYSLQNLGKFIQNNEEIKEQSLLIHIPEHRPSELRHIIVLKPGYDNNIVKKITSFFSEATEITRQSGQVLPETYKELWDKLGLYLEMQESLPTHTTNVKRPKI